MSQDKYQPIPGEMDTIDCVRKERDELKESLRREREKTQSLIMAGKRLASDLGNEIKNRPPWHQVALIQWKEVLESYQKDASEHENHQ